MKPLNRQNATLARSILDGNQVRIHVGNIVLLMPVVRKESHEATHLEPSLNLRHEVGVVAIGEVPERILVVIRHMSWVLERSPTVTARSERQQQSTMGKHSVELVEQGNLVRDVLEEVLSPNDTN